MHMSRMLRATMVTGALPPGGSAVRIAGASEESTSSTTTTPTTSAAPTSSTSKQPCPDIGLRANGRCSSGSESDSSSGAGYVGAATGASAL